VIVANHKITLSLISQRPNLEQAPWTGAGWLAAGRCQVYLHGKQQLWDYAAGSLILAEAGGYAVTLEGEPVCQKSLATRSVVTASNRQLFQQWVDCLGIHLQQTEDFSV